MDQVYNQEFTLLLVNVLSYLVQARFHSCVGLAIGVWLLVSFSISLFHLFSTYFLITIRIHIGISYPTFAHLFMMLVWSYHWWFIYPFVMLLIWEWTHYNSWYNCNKKMKLTYKQRFRIFSLPYMEMNGYYHHRKWYWTLTNVVTVDLTHIDLI
jgi:hypothetical protein